MNKQKHISFFIPSLEGGGAERHLLNLANAIVTLDVSVNLVVAGRLGQLGPQLDKRVHVIELKSSSVFRSLFKLCSFLKKSKPDALYSLLDNANVVAFVALKLARTKTPFFPSAHGDGVFSTKAKLAKGFKAKLLFALVKYIYRFFPIITTVSKGSRSDVIAYTGISPDRVVVIYNAILHDKINVLAREKITHPWFTNVTTPVLVAAGRLSHEKNFPLLISSISIVVKFMPIRLVIFGEGLERKKLQEQIDALNLSQHILLHGFENNIYKYLKHCDLFVLSSLSESLSCVLVEALSLSPNVISTNCYFGPSEVLENGAYGYLVDNNNVDALANGIIDALKHPKVFENKIRSLSRFESTEIAKQYIGLLDHA